METHDLVNGLLAETYSGALSAKGAPGTRVSLGIAGSVVWVRAAETAFADKDGMDELFDHGAVRALDRTLDGWARRALARVGAWSRSRSRSRSRHGFWCRRLALDLQ